MQEFINSLYGYMEKAVAELLRDITEAGRIPAPGAEMKFEWVEGTEPNTMHLKCSIDTIPNPEEN